MSVIPAKYQFDHLDIEIMRVLKRNARIPFLQLAQQLKVSNSLVHQRVRKLEEAGVLSEPTYQLSPSRLGYKTCARVQIMLMHARYIKAAVEALIQIPEIVECVNIAGRYAIMVKIYTLNNSHLRDVVYESIQTIEGVEGTNTTVLFETNFSRGVSLQPDWLISK